MDLEQYNRSYEEIVEKYEEEADNKLKYIRQQCVRDFIERLNARQQDWDATFRDLLSKSQKISDSLAPIPTFQPSLDSPKPNLFNSIGTSPNEPTQTGFQDALDLSKENAIPEASESFTKEPAISLALFTHTPSQAEPNKSQVKDKEQQVVSKPDSIRDDKFTDPQFSNFNAIREFIRIQEFLDHNRKLFADITTNPALKSFKNDLNLVIRTQINSISNSDSQHLDSKTRLLTNLFNGQRVSFQDRFIDASQHPQGQLFSMDLAASTFVTVGTRLVNSVPAIAKSMATVINGIVAQIPIFKDLILGHLQERCPYLVPTIPKLEDFLGVNDQQMRYKIACGYSYDTKLQSLESEEKYLARMRSMVLIYACILIQGHMSQTWTWLASFLSLNPQPVISATILQAFLQEASKKLSSTYGRQYMKMLTFIRKNYVRMIEEVTPKTTDRQTFIKLQNLLSDDSKLISTPPVTSIFGAIRMG